MESLKVRPVINKKNNQINISLPKNQLSEKFKNDIQDMESIDIKIERWKCDKALRRKS